MKNIKVVDLFCGVGGLTNGLQQAGLKVVAGFDFDESCKFAYESNNNSKFFHKDICSLSSVEVSKHFQKASIKVLVGCAPCQPFSSYNYKNKNSEEDKWQLLYEFTRIIKEVMPDIVSMENVPQLMNFKKAPVLQDFIRNLESLGYQVSYQIVFAPDYGVPQGRRRLILLASKLGEIKLIEPLFKKNEYKTVRSAIGALPILNHGESDPNDYLHRSSRLSELNLSRIRASKQGGSWKQDWSDDLKLNCHKAASGKTYGSVYGRMSWDSYAPTMTTFCTGIGNGRFGHPEQDRGISLREAAILQSFPKNYKFAPSKDLLKSSIVATHIGNAVPPLLGKAIGISIIKHIEGINNHGKKA